MLQHLEVGPSGGNVIMKVKSLWVALVPYKKRHKRDYPSLNLVHWEDLEGSGGEGGGRGDWVGEHM